MSIPAALVQAVRQRQVVLFAGAGISYNALRIGGRELRDTMGALIARDHPAYDIDSRSVEDVCDEFEG